MGTIQLLLKSRVKDLMDAYDETCTCEDEAIGIKVYHDAVLKDMESEEEAAMANVPDPSE